MRTVEEANIPAKNYYVAGKVLSRQQMQFYHENGYIVLKRYISPKDLEKYRNRFNDICDGKNVPKDMTIMRDVSYAAMKKPAVERTVLKVQDFNNDPIMFSYCKTPQIVEVVQDLIGTPNSTLMAMHGMLINKPPDAGNLSTRHPMHQDSHFFPFRPVDYVCCAWTAMEKVNRANGCLVVVPGTHRLPLLEHGYPKWEGGVNKAFYGVTDFDPNSPRVHLEMEAGDTVFFHPNLLHGSGANRTEGFRKAISCHYANGSVCDYIDVGGTNQEQVEKVMMDVLKARSQRLGLPYDANWKLKDLWRGRARPVLGQRARL
ncbi:unnamed protein product [Bursaphelenchus xylophilus]|uniref:phytanoyl-CoA dioxygenase n=1 Tax=Bursaphelenchus xylophilus TaxID=6326 RepID=A0A1I7S4H0_BURXY|nr:unnamed protein product [Bursaphelenchus xylophilus]CAG9117080.1 unnamed protein product [Bursaphelenchus xylophilus]